jgi:lysophospholipase L1-like esterase
MREVAVRDWSFQMTPEEEEEYLRTHPAFAPVEDDPVLPRVLLVGDSISVGYTIPVRGLLSGQANLHRVPANAESTAKGIGLLEDWLGTERWDVIVFNFGLHDVLMLRDEPRISLGLYRARLAAMIDMMQGRGRRLIWVNSTPVTRQCETHMERRWRIDPTRPYRRNKDVIRYNAMAQRLMDEQGIPVVDLYSFALPKLDEIQLPRNVHFTDDGYAVLAQPVAEAILETLHGPKDESGGRSA